MLTNEALRACRKTHTADFFFHFAFPLVCGRHGRHRCGCRSEHSFVINFLAGSPPVVSNCETKPQQSEEEEEKNGPFEKCLINPINNPQKHKQTTLFRFMSLFPVFLLLS